MTERRKYALVDLRWLPLPTSLKYPDAHAFGSTGYREEDGPVGLFSVYVKILGGGRPGAGVEQSAKLYALVEPMDGRLPQIGTKFLISTGTTLVAECVTRGRGEASKR